MPGQRNSPPGRDDPEARATGAEEQSSRHDAHRDVAARNDAAHALIRGRGSVQGEAEPCHGNADYDAVGHIKRDHPEGRCVQRVGGCVRAKAPGPGKKPEWRVHQVESVSVRRATLPSTLSSTLIA